MVKEYILKIRYNTKTQEIEHLSESFTDEDIIQFIVEDESIQISDEFRDILQDLDTITIGIS